jgi:hypothetical protein
METVSIWLRCGIRRRIRLSVTWKEVIHQQLGAMLSASLGPVAKQYFIASAWKAGNSFTTMDLPMYTLTRLGS